MKVITLLILSTLMTSLAFGQKKGKVDPQEVTIDSLAHTLDSVSGILSVTTRELDSISKELTKYQIMYSAVKEKVTTRDFDPTKMGMIIDSLRTGRDATFSSLSAESKMLRDSIASLSDEISKQKAAVDSMTTVMTDKTPLINELKQLKELLDAGIINQEEFDIRKQKLLERW